LAQTLWEGLVGGMLYALIALGFVLMLVALGVNVLLALLQGEGGLR